AANAEHSDMHLDRGLRAVLAPMPADEESRFARLQRIPNRPRLRQIESGIDVEHIQAQQLLARIAETEAGLAIDVDKIPFGIVGKKSVGRVFQKQTVMLSRIHASPPRTSPRAQLLCAQRIV